MWHYPTGIEAEIGVLLAIFPLGILGLQIALEAHKVLKTRDNQQQK